jgi:hypothetical protein
MTDLIERDNSIEAKAGVYYLGRRVFFILFVLTFIALVVLSFAFDAMDNAEVMFTELLWTTVFWFFGYKLADYRVQHVETIQYYKQDQKGTDEGV